MVGGPEDEAPGTSTTYVTNVVSTMIVDLSKPVASKITSYLITAYVTPPTKYVTKYNTAYISRITALTTRYWLEGKVYTTIRVPTDIVVGTSYASSPAGAIPAAHPTGVGETRIPTVRAGAPTARKPLRAGAIR